MTTLYLNTNALMCTLKTVGMALMVGLSPVVLQAQLTNLINHNFTGSSNTNLSGTAVGGFDSAKITGVTGNWAGTSWFKADGSSAAGNGTFRSGYIDLGGYIDSAKGTSEGLFRLSSTFDVTDNWLSIGFSLTSTPPANGHYAEPATAGFASLRYVSGAASQSHVLGGTSEANHDTFSGPTTFSIELDYRLWDGETNFGTITWYESENLLRTVDLDATTGAELPRSILISRSAAGGVGTYSELSLQQIPEPATAGVLLGLVAAGLCLARRRLQR
jgi:hypothetical protein